MIKICKHKAFLQGLTTVSTEDNDRTPRDLIGTGSVF